MWVSKKRFEKLESRVNYLESEVARNNSDTPAYSRLQKKLIDRMAEDVAQQGKAQKELKERVEELEINSKIRIPDTGGVIRTMSGIQYVRAEKISTKSVLIELLDTLGLSLKHVAGTEPKVILEEKNNVV